MTARGHHFVPQCYLRGFLRNQEGMERGPPRGYGMKGTQVIFPVSRRVAVSGAFEHDDDIERDIDEAAVANLNSLILMFAEQQVYGRDGDVRFRSPRTDRLVRGVDLLGEMAHPKWRLGA